jgi:uncharacterized FlgJ-related protein
MKDDRINNLIIWKLLEDNKTLWDDNFQLVEEIDLLEGMMDSMEAYYDVLVGELQEENDKKDQYIKSLENMIKNNQRYNNNVE